jgi:hypothetical protein
MVQTIVRPKESSFDMAVSLPNDYIGKVVHVLFYIDEEIKTTTSTVLSKKKPSDFFGILNKEEGEKFENHINKIRTEWDRNI